MRKNCAQLCPVLSSCCAVVTMIPLRYGNLLAKSNKRTKHQSFKLLSAALNWWQKLTELSVKNPFPPVALCCSCWLYLLPQFRLCIPESLQQPLLLIHEWCLIVLKEELLGMLLEKLLGRSEEVLLGRSGE